MDMNTSFLGMLDNGSAFTTTREFLDRFGLNDISDLPKVEEMSDALGFELPSALMEPTVTTQLPFDADAAASEPAAAVEAMPAVDETVH